MSAIDYLSTFQDLATQHHIAVEKGEEKEAEHIYEAIKAFHHEHGERILSELSILKL